MGIYFSNSKDYIFLDYEDVLGLLNNFDEDSLVRVKKTQEIEIPTSAPLFCIEAADIYRVRESIRHIANDILGIDEFVGVDRVNRGTPERKFSMEEIESMMEQFTPRVKEFLHKEDKLGNLCYQDDKIIEVNFEFKKHKSTEKFELGSSVSCSTVELKENDYFEKSLKNQIIRNPFFKNMSSNIAHLQFVECKEVDSDNLCVRIPLKNDSNLILKQTEVLEYLEKYKEEDNVFIRPKVDEKNMVLA